MRLVSKRCDCGAEDPTRSFIVLHLIIFSIVIFIHYLYHRIYSCSGSFIAPRELTNFFFDFFFVFSSRSQD